MWAARAPLWVPLAELVEAEALGLGCPVVVGGRSLAP